MLYINILNGQASTEYPGESDSWQSRNDWATLEAAERVAEKASNSPLNDGYYIAVDSGRGVRPRYDVVRAPKIGDEVSFSFNGDSYPCGHIVSISPTLKKVTAESEGGQLRHFYRFKQTGSWKLHKTWSLVRGHHYAQNPSF